MTKSVDNIFGIIFNPMNFKILILPILLVVQVPFAHLAIGHLIKYVLLYGILICVYDAIKNNGLTRLNDKVNVLLIAFCVLYAITIVINHQQCLADNLKQLAYMIVFFWLLFMVPSNSDEAHILREIRMVAIVIVCTSFVLSVASISTYILNINEWYAVDENSPNYLIGTYYERLCGFYNPNSCGAIALLSLVSSLQLFFTAKTENLIKRIVFRVLLAVNISVQFLALLLSKSRGAYYSLLIAVTVAVFLVVIKNTNYRLLLRSFLAIALSIIVFTGVVKFSDFVQSNVSNLIVVSDEQSNDIEQDTSYENYIESIILKYYEISSAQAGFMRLFVTEDIANGIGRDDIGSTTGRSDLWRAGFKVFLDAPLFGVTNERLAAKVNEKLGNAQDTSFDGGLHNIYITVLACSGAVGFTAIVIAVFVVLIKFIKACVNCKRINLEFLFSFVMVIAFLFSQFVESTILYQVTIYNAVFWLYFGYLYYFVKIRLAEKEKKQID